MTYSTTLFRLTLFFFVCYFFVACRYSGELKEVQATSNDGKVEYAISFPDYMKLETEKALNPNASLQYASFYRNIYALVIDEAQSVANVSLADYYHQELTALEEVLKNPLRIDSSRVEVASKTAYQIQLVGKVGEGEVEKRIYYHLAFFEANQHLFQLVLWGWDERRDQYVHDFDKIVESFRVIN